MDVLELVTVIRSIGHLEQLETLLTACALMVGLALAVVILHGMPPPALPLRLRPSARWRRVSAADHGRCPVCGTPADGNWTACPDCATPHHVECRDYNRGCAIYGCASGPAE